MLVGAKRLTDRVESTSTVSWVSRASCGHVNMECRYQWWRPDPAGYAVRNSIPASHDQSSVQ